MVKEDATALSNARADMYRFLSGIFLEEPDGDRLAAMKKMDFPQSAQNEELREGYALLKKHLEKAGEDDLEEIAADYASVFLAAGSATGRAAFPYESAYLSSARLAGGESAGDVAALYAEKGLKPSKVPYRAPADHIGFETAYMAHLCGLSAEASENGDKAAYAAGIAEQRTFLLRHLLRWHRAFCADARKYAATDFYRAAAEITRGFLDLEASYFEGEEQPWAID
jgi:anaerobic sulfite reductase subunit A